ncbi:hypothetical protein ACFE04_016095 [Oxalis oulophora]
MSYVPPHLRNTLTTTKTSSSSSVVTLTNSDKLSYSSYAANSNNNNTTFSATPRRNSASALSPPPPVFADWKPSLRVQRLTPQQIEDVRTRLNVDVSVAEDYPPAPAPIESFADMSLNENIMKDITFHDYTMPTSIQAQAMPVALSGRDLLGCAETGSGKTAAFSIPMIQHCLSQSPIQRGDGPLALVLAPTRELAQQIEKEVKAFSRSLESFKTVTVVGGTNISDQRSELRAGVDVIVATPGRLIDHLQQGNTSLLRVSFIVLDEADRMLDMGFEPQIREVMRNLPEKHQTLLFSATMPVEIEALAQEYLNNPVQVKVGQSTSPAANVVQSLEKVTDSGKIDRLLSLLVEEASRSDRTGHPFPLTIVFVERKTRCDEVAEALVAQGLHAVPLHGGRSQSEREAALHDFRNGRTNILVATDVASRGLDVTGVAHVINLDLPKTKEDYIHRIGRTGRAGSMGQATSFYTDHDKVARKKEREAAAAQREARTALAKLTIMGASAVNIEDKYRFMIAPPSIKAEGAADSAWDD